MRFSLVMPPKKKKDDGKKKEKKISKKSFGGPQAQDQLNDQSREYYLTQIKDLENRIDRFVIFRSCSNRLGLGLAMADLVLCEEGQSRENSFQSSPLPFPSPICHSVTFFLLSVSLPYVLFFPSLPQNGPSHPSSGSGGAQCVPPAECEMEPSCNDITVI